MCAQCMKANRECIPSSGITFRHQQNPSMNGDPVARESLKRFYGYKETFDDRTVWVDVPQELTFVHTSNPYEDEDGLVHDEIDDSTLMGNTSVLIDDKTQLATELSLSQALYPAYATHGLEALSAVASQDQYNYAPPPATMTQQDLSHTTHSDTASPQHSNATPAQNIDFILNNNNNNNSSAISSASPSNIDPRLHTPTSTSQTFGPPQASSPHHVRTLSYTSTRPLSLQSKGSRPPPIHDRELAFFLRDFSERAGNWMDIFDLDRYFGAQVPALAVSCPLLLYSCAALSAKSLARVNGKRPPMNAHISGRRRLQQWQLQHEHYTADDWMRKGRENYDVAVSLLRQSLCGASKPRSSALPSDVTPQTVTTAQGAPLPATDSDELVAATAILCVYEFLDASGMEWSRHLDGAKTLFDIAKEGMIPLALPNSPAAVVELSQTLSNGLASSPSTKSLSSGRIAVFWNFARQDMLSAFINSTRTRVDTADILMWTRAGLKLNADAKLCPSNPKHPAYERANAMPDDMICNALIWLMAKLVNFIELSESGPDMLSPTGGDLRQKMLFDAWTDLDEQLAAWYDGLPDTFMPCALQPGNGSTRVDEKWFSRSMCASTMQSYHFARIQLLHNKPQSITQPAALRRSGSFSAPGSSLAARHAEYTNLLQQTRTHAKEIVTMALGRADEGARVHSVQPLWTAGLVLGGDIGDDGVVSGEAALWRRVIVEQLRAIEKDMGWATEYRVQNLLELWGLPPEWTPDDVDMTSMDTS